ncbi:MAG: hypothetical protein GF400_07630 [Candidatus Eisenbacteria bacterium]|nr:hypothetical protein [Candidatus Eisenbacteria bacterium]
MRGPLQRQVTRLLSLLSLAFVSALTVSSCNSQPTSGPESTPFDEIAETDRDSLGFYLEYPEAYETAIDLGATVVNLQTKGTYFVFWFPPGFHSQAEKRVLVMLHGSDGVAYRSLLRMSTVGEEQGFGIVAVQWGWPSSWGEDYVYLDPDDTHEVISTALEYLDQEYGIDEHRSAWDGFSIASTRCAVHAHIDRLTGTDYFSFFMAISGGCTATYPPMADLLDGLYGPDPVSGSRYYFWCGTADLDSLRCASLWHCATLVESLGGTIDEFAVADGMEHADYYLEAGRDYQRDAVALWKNATSGDQPPR